VSSVHSQCGNGGWSVVSTGGLTALVMRVLRKKKGEKSDSKERE
jgi:hypothetical protein